MLTTSHHPPPHPTLCTHAHILTGTPAPHYMSPTLSPHAQHLPFTPSAPPRQPPLHVALTYNPRICHSPSPLPHLHTRPLHPGTPHYMSPEVISARPYTSASDIWALGCVLYEAAARTPAFAAKGLPQVGLCVGGGCQGVRGECRTGGGGRETKPKGLPQVGCWGGGGGVEQDGGVRGVRPARLQWLQYACGWLQSACGEYDCLQLLVCAPEHTRFMCRSCLWTF